MIWAHENTLGVYATIKKNRNKDTNFIFYFIFSRCMEVWCREKNKGFYGGLKSDMAMLR